MSLDPDHRENMERVARNLDYSSRKALNLGTTPEPDPVTEYDLLSDLARAHGWYRYGGYWWYDQNNKARAAERTAWDASGNFLETSDDPVYLLRVALASDGIRLSPVVDTVPAAPMQVYIGWMNRWDSPLCHGYVVAVSTNREEVERACAAEAASRPQKYPGYQVAAVLINKPSWWVYVVVADRKDRGPDQSVLVGAYTDTKDAEALIAPFQHPSWRLSVTEYDLR